VGLVTDCLNLKMQRNSLALRLIATSAGWSVVILVITGVLLSSLFRSAVERTFDDRLLLTLDALLANIEYDDTGQLIESAALGDSRFVFPLRGWYWQVTSLEQPPRTEIRSGSLLEKSLRFPENAFGRRDKDGMSRFYHIGPEGHQLRIIEQKYQLDGATASLSFVVTGNSDELEAEIASFDRTLLIALSLLALGLVISACLQVHFGLQPLRRLRAGLVKVRTGTAARLGGKFPHEIQPVADELNALLTTNEETVERARTQVGNLAHALKTPLSVISNEAQVGQDPVAIKIAGQVAVMTDQINLYLDRARRAARRHVQGLVTDVAPVVDDLVRTLRRINSDKNLDVQVECESDVHFLGERQDLEEMIGNLLDNAFKWSKKTVSLTARHASRAQGLGRDQILIIVEDDGPGLPAERHKDALMRGRRLDETKPGDGLGLSIVAETASMYEGEISLGISLAKGLKVELRLPGAGPAAE